MGLPQASQILTPAPGEKVKERLYIGLLLAIVAFAYGNTLVNAFTMDDIALYVVRNTQVTHPSLPALFAPHQATNVFRPVTFSTFALDWKLGGGRPFLFHLVNLVLHAAVTWLLYLLLQTVLRSSPDGKPDGKTVAFACALLFAVHPIHTEAVASIVGRAELLAAGFLLAAWILHLRDREISALICFVLALLSKESAVVFLPLAAIGDYASGKWKPASRYLRIAGLTLLYLGVLWKVQGGHFGMADIQRLNNPLATIPTGWRILNALRVAWKYVGLLGARTVVRNRVWKDNLTLYSAAVRAVPRSAKMHEALGATYVELGQLDLARKELQIALSIEPDFPYALEAYGLVESWKHNYQAAGPLLEKAFHLSRRDDPNYDDMAVNLAAVYLQTDQASKALDLLNREISEAPGYARAWSNRAVLRYKGRETALARADAETALRLDPSNKQAQNLMQLLNTSSPSVLTK